MCVCVGGVCVRHGDGGVANVYVRHGKAGVAFVLVMIKEEWSVLVSHKGGAMTCV